MFTGSVPGRSGFGPDAANPCGSLEDVVSTDDAQRTQSRLRLQPEGNRGIKTEKGRKLTVLDNGLVVLDRLYEKSKGQ